MNESYAEWQREFRKSQTIPKNEKAKPKGFVLFLAMIFYSLIVTVVFFFVVSIALRIAGWSDFLSARQVFGLCFGISSLRGLDRVFYGRNPF
jgi:hypothetical protein